MGQNQHELEKCKWKRDTGDSDWGWWITSCDNLFKVSDAPNSDMGIKFCPYCGKELEEVDE